MPAFCWFRPVTCHAVTLLPEGSPAAGASVGAYSQPSPKNRVGDGSSPSSFAAGKRKPPPTTSLPFGQDTAASALPPAATGTFAVTTETPFSRTQIARTPTA